MGADIDQLNIKIEAAAQKAHSSVDTLINKLGRLNAALGEINTINLTSLSNGVQRLSNSMQSMKNVGTADFTRLAKNISKIGEIEQGQVDKKKYGVGIDDLLGDVYDGKYDGKYHSQQTSPFKLDFSGISAIEGNPLIYKFAYTSVTDVDLRDLEYSGTVEDADYKGGYLDNTFTQCGKLSSVNFQNLKRLGGSPVYPGLKDTFSHCISLRSISFPSLTAINSYGLDGSFTGMT